MKPLAKRKTASLSRRKLIAAVDLFEKYVDGPIDAIETYSFSGTLFKVKSSGTDYHVDVAANKVDRAYPDPD